MSWEQAPAALLLAVSMAAALSGGIVKKYFCSRISSGQADRHLYNAISSLTAALVLFFCCGISSCSVFTLLLGVAFGAVTAVQQITSLQSMELGPWSYTSVLISLSTLIPALSGSLFWHEQIRLPQIFGMVLMAGCLFLSAEWKSDRKKASLRWFLYCMTAFLCTGMIGVMQKWHQNSDARAEINAFLLIAFAFSFLYSGCGWLLYSRRSRKARPVCAGKPFTAAAIMAASGLFAAVNNILNLYLSGIMPSAVFFPVVNVGGLILTMAAAILLFRERLDKKQWAGITPGILSVFFLCSPFS